MVWEITGNHYVTFCLGSDASIQRINVLHAGLGGLLEWSSAPGVEDGRGLMRPVLLRGGEPIATGAFTHARVDRWIPQYHAEPFPDLYVRMTVCAPGGYDATVRGGLVQFELENRATIEQTLQVGVEGEWSWAHSLVRSVQPMVTPNRVARGRTDDGLTLTAGAEGMGAALGLRIGGGAAAYEVADGDGSYHALAPGAAVTKGNGDAHRFRALGEVRLPPGGRARVAVYVGAAPEQDGALATAAHLARTGAARLLRDARLELARLVRRSDDVALSELLNRNLIFNYYAAVARGVDDDHVHPISSRSPQHGTTAACNEREALLWTLPALCVTDPLLARELLMRVIEQFSDRPGHQWRYVNGSVLAPGVSLHQLCAYGVAVDHYVNATDDRTLLEEPVVQDAIRDLDDLIFARLHPEIFLASTDVLPSGDRPDQPYGTYDNVLLWLFVRALDRIWTLTERPRLANAAEEIASALWSKCTVDIEGVRVLAYTADLERDATVYDDPLGSLRLLPFHEFCTLDDPVWSETMALLRSPRYPLWHGGRAFAGHADRIDPDHVVLASVCADLLADRPADALALLQRLPLADGLACDAFHPDTGAVARGPHAAAAAGFLGWALTRALRARKPMRSAVRRAS